VSLSSGVCYRKLDTGKPDTANLLFGIPYSRARPTNRTTFEARGPTELSSELRIAIFLRLTSKMSHDHSRRDSCEIRISCREVHSKTDKVARGVTSPGVGSGALFGERRSGECWGTVERVRGSKSRTPPDNVQGSNDRTGATGKQNPGPRVGSAPLHLEAPGRCSRTRPACSKMEARLLWLSCPRHLPTPDLKCESRSLPNVKDEPRRRLACLVPESETPSKCFVPIIVRSHEA